MGFFATMLCAPVLLLPQRPATAPRLPLPHPEVVLADAADPVPLAAFGLGDGGAGSAAGGPRFDGGECLTPGGVRVQCRAIGVRLVFPSGRELLFAADGFLHLRSGEKGGPFPFGAELRLGDGAAVRVTLAQSQRDRVRDVVVVTGECAVQPWRRGAPQQDEARIGPWGGVRLCCCGDGGDLYRAIAIGPLVVLDRVLAAADRLQATPEERLVVLTSPLLAAMSLMPRQHTGSAAELRHAVRAVAATAARGDAIFPSGASLRRTETDRLRWSLGLGCELQLDLEGHLAPRLALFEGRSLVPMVEWAVRTAAAAYLPNPRQGEPGAGRWHGNGTRLPPVARDLQAREELFEYGYAMQVVRRLLR